MKLGTGILFSLFLLIIVLAADLVLTKKQADNLHVQGTAALIDLSNQLDSAAFALKDLRRGGQMMTNDLAAASQRFELTSNDLADFSGRLTSAKGELDAEKIRSAELGGRVQGLLPKNQELNERTGAYSNHFVLWSSQLLALQQQLEISRSNDLFLAAELRKQVEQKNELQRRFNDLDEIRARFNYLAYGFY
jgi:chromosome segregation ATPase